MSYILKAIQLKTERHLPVYSTEDCQNLIDAYEDFYPKFGFTPPWIGYFIFRADQIVGSASFVGPPKEGVVEIAYWTFKDYEKQGVASFACKELVMIAHRENPNIRVTAKTAPEPNASTRILEKSGFVFSNTVQDEEIGNAWMWIFES
ncbi:MAG: GNAT family N-acetyltransferase [Crocinitomicaceae bacterium]